MGVSMETSIVQGSGRQLPAELPRAAQRAGYQMLAALDRLGMTHENQDGTVFAVRFCDVALYGGRWASYQVDGERLWHFSAPELMNERVVSTLELATGLPVKRLAQDTRGRRGIFYVADLAPDTPKPQAARLPGRVALDLDSRPADPIMAPIGHGRDGAVWRTLPSLGHTLIMGASGSGKSTWLHCGLAALLTGAGPDMLQVVLIDPKQIELSIWGNAPHLRGPVVWSVEDATRALADLADEMDRRGELLAGVGARDLPSYNRRAAEPLPYILAVVDEALDLTLQAGDSSQLVTLLKRIASKGRATGLYLWLAATHGTADVLPRVVSVNLASRVVFRVQDGNAARMAGCPGAERIERGKPGRLLARIDGEPIELQGYYLADEDLAAIAGGLAGRPGGGLSLSDSEAMLVAWAMDEGGGGGYLSLDDIQSVGGLGQKAAVRLAKAWERRGWLEKDPKHGNKRRVTEALSDCTG